MAEENSIFIEYFGSSPLIKVLDFLIEGVGFDYSMTEIAKGSEVGWSAFSRIWKQLTKKEIVKQTRTIGNAKLFTLNKENEFIKLLLKFDKELMKLELKQSKKVVA